MSKDEIQESAGRAPAPAGYEVSGLSSGILAAADELETHQLRLLQAEKRYAPTPVPEEELGLLGWTLAWVFLPLTLPLGFVCLAYEKIWQPIAGHLKAAKQVKLETEARLAELVVRSSGGSLPSPEDLELEGGMDHGQESKALLDQAQSLVDRATQTLHAPGQGALADKEDKPDAYPYLCPDKGVDQELPKEKL